MTESPPRSFCRAILRIESAYVLIETELYSAEARHTFERRFDQTQVHLYDAFGHEDLPLPLSMVAEASQELLDELKRSTGVLDDAIRWAEGRLGAAGIADPGRPGTKPLKLKVKIFSGIARRYLELIGKFDLMVLMLEKMLVNELIGETEFCQQKATAKAPVRHLANLAFELCNRARDYAEGRRVNRVRAGTRRVGKPRRAARARASESSSTGSDRSSKG